MALGDEWHDPRFAAEWDDSGNLRTNPDRWRQLSLLADLLVASGAKHVLDLGIGSAQVESFIHRRHGTFFDRCQVTGIDASDAMLNLARVRLERDNLSNCRLVQADFAMIADIDLAVAPDAVICVQALHEVPHAVKQSVFRWVRRQLSDGRPFLVLDRFVYPRDEWLDEWRVTWNWMRSGVDNDIVEFDEYQRRYRDKADHVASVEDYRQWLAGAGFESVCPYWCFNRALIVARA